MLRARKEGRGGEVRGETPNVVWINQFGFVNFPHLRARGEMAKYIGLVHATVEEKRLVDETWV